jgi:hypothetical protein
MCTIADAKVRQNYNCYNVYFNECLLIRKMGSENMIKISDPMISSVANKSSVKHNCHLPFSELHISRPTMTKIPVLVIDKLEVRQ